MLRPVERADPFFCNPTAISGREGAYILNRKHSRPRLLDHPCRETTKKLEGGKECDQDQIIPAFSSKLLLSIVLEHKECAARIEQKTCWILMLLLRFVDQTSDSDRLPL